MRPWIAVAALLVSAAPAALTAVPTPALAQVQAGRTLGPAEVRELRAQLGGAVSQRDAARRQAAMNRANLVRVAEVFGLPADTAPSTVADRLKGWAEQDQKNREDLAQLKELVDRIESGEAKTVSEQYVRQADAAFEDGRLADADHALARLEALRRSSQSEARQVWVDAVIARSSLADQRLDGDTARRLVREARQEERALSNHIQWRYAMREAESFKLEDPRRQDNTALEEALDLYRDEALPLIDRTRNPEDWAETQNALGNILVELGGRETGTQRLREAIDAFNAALEVRTRDRFPQEWARSHSNLGNALNVLGGREGGPDNLERAVAAYRAALEVRTREADPLAWATTQANLGGVLFDLDAREGGTDRIEEAIALYRTALEAQPREQVPMDWASTQASLANASVLLARRKGGTESVTQAVAAYRLAAEEITRERRPLEWAMLQSNLANALAILGQMEGSVELMEQALAAYSAALEVRTRERVPLEWAETQVNIGLTLAILGSREAGLERLQQSVEAYRRALEVYSREESPLRWATAQNNMGNVLRLLGERDPGGGWMDRAVEAYRAALLERTRERAPTEWATTRYVLATSLVSIARRSGDLTALPAAREDLLGAAEVFDAAGAAANAVAVRRLVGVIDELTAN